MNLHILAEYYSMKTQKAKQQSYKVQDPASKKHWNLHRTLSGT